jgi:membrane protein YqaA with SNARE-associated domain
MPMSENNTENTTEAVKKERNWKKTALDVSMILLVVAITVILFINGDKFKDLDKFGYLGAFLISLIANASIVLPVPGLALLIVLGKLFNPFLVALFGGIGGAIGELTGYMLGRSGRGITSNNKWYVRAESWMKKRGFLTVFLFALLPILPLDVAGLIAGISRYSLWKFLLACFLGKLILYTIMVYMGDWGLDWVERWLL